MPGRVLVVQHVPHSSLGVPELRLPREAVGGGTPVLPATRAQLEAAEGVGTAERSLPAVNGIARTLMHAWREAAEA